MKKFITDYYTISIISLSFNVLLLLGLFSPDVVYWIHKEWFKWRDKDELNAKIK